MKFRITEQDAKDFLRERLTGTFPACKIVDVKFIHVYSDGSGEAETSDISFVDIELEPKEAE